MSYVATGVAVAGLAMSAYGTFGKMRGEAGAGLADRLSMEAQAGMADYDAAQQEEVKQEAITSANQQETMRTLQLQRLMSSNLAGSATTGTSSDSASYRAVESANLTGAGTDIQNIAYKGAQEVDQADARIVQDKFKAQVYRSGGVLAENAGNMRAMGAAAMGGYQIAQNVGAYGKSIGGWFKTMSNGSYSGETNLSSVNGVQN